MLILGNLQLPYPVMLAPMAGISDLPFRLINRSFGAPFAFTEMIDVRAISHRDKRTRSMLLSCAEDRPLGVQLLGSDEKYILPALEVLSENTFDLLDFNAACPTPKVTRKGKGAALLKEPRKLASILKSLVDRSGMPVTVKIRTGWDIDSINACDVALRAEDAGVTAVFIHGRTRIQGYSGEVDYKNIGAVKKALRVPVIASGDNLSLPLIRKMFNETGCDGVALARGTLGNPWIFRNARELLSQDAVELKPVSKHERIETIREHFKLVIDHFRESERCTERSVDQT
ncbi:MAG TPA: tRNA-dihydrouridine synthase, partial [Syntrophorhabdaceae bacterium]|nr:tRNA-dihydrouridine synthase [Syntrophorhabdaceae bacterium]